MHRQSTHRNKNRANQRQPDPGQSPVKIDQHPEWQQPRAIDVIALKIGIHNIHILQNITNISQ